MYTPPKIADEAAQIIADIEAETGQTTPIFKRAFVRVLAKALAGVLASLHRRILWAYRQIHTATCDEEALAYKEDRFGIIPPPAIAAVLQVSISGDEGAVSPKGAQWASLDSGLVYTQEAAATISAGSASARLTCTKAGEASTLPATSTLSPVSPLAGISRATVSSVDLAGQDAATLEERRRAVQARERRTNEIGTIGYYVSVALEVSGITFALAKRTDSGDVAVYPLKALTGISRVPDASLLATVQAYLQDARRRPLCANVYALSTTERTASATIAGLSPADAATKARIESDWAPYCYAAYPRQFSDDPTPTDVISVGDLWAIVRANGARCTGVTLNISGIGNGVTDYSLPIGEIIKPGVITWA